MTITDTTTATTTRQEAAPSALRSLVAAVLEDTDALEARVVQATVDLEPRYRSGGPDLDDLTGSVRANIVRVLEAFLADEADDRFYDAPRATGRRRARQGFPLEAVLRAYRLGVELIWEALLVEARSRGPEATDLVVDEVSRLWYVMDRFSLAVAEAYRREEEQLRRHDVELQERLLDELLDGRGAEPAVAADLHRLMGLPAVARYVVVEGEAAPPRPGQASPGEQLAAYAITSYWCRRSGRDVGVVHLGQATVDRVCRLLAAALPDGRVGVSNEVSTLAEVARAHRQADLALATLPAHQPGVAVLDARLPEALLVSSPEVSARLVRRAFGRVLDLAPEERDALIATLAAWFAHHHSTAAAARALHCHRNTVINRLARFQQVSDGCLDDERHRLVCHLALTAWMGEVHNPR